MTVTRESAADKITRLSQDRARLTSERDALRNRLAELERANPDALRLHRRLAEAEEQRDRARDLCVLLEAEAAS